MKKYILCVVVVSVVFPLSLRSQWLDQRSESEREERMDRPDRYLQWFYGHRAFGLGYIPKDGRINAIKQRDKMREEYLRSLGQIPQSGTPKQPLALNEWIPIGPINIEQGVQAHAGRIRTIVTHPTNPYVAYCGAAMGGIWKTTNAGRNWKPMSDDAYSLAMGALAIDPVEPSVLYAGTGEHTPNVDAYYGVGILKSTDSGMTWKPKGLEIVGAFSKIFVHPKNNQTVFAAGSRSGGGIYKSTDGGEKWQKLSGGLPPADVTDMDFCLNGNTVVIYAGLPSQGVYRSTDEGQTWEKMYEFFQMRRILISVDKKDWKDVVAMSVASDGSFEELSRSNDGGETWNTIDEGLRANNIFSVGAGQQGWYDAYVVRDPENAEHIIVGGISIWLSEDGGSSWTDVGKAYKGGIHPDQHAGAFAVPTSGGGEGGTFYGACDGGIVVSPDKGLTYNVFQDDLSVTQFYGMSIDQNVEDLTYGGTQDNGTLRGSRATDWEFIAGGDGGTVVVDEDNSNRIFFLRPGDNNPPFKIENGVTSQISSGINLNDSIGWVTPLVMDQEKNILYYGSQRLYFSTNNGASWTRRSRSLAYPGYINCIEPYGDGNTLGIGTTDGKVWYTTNNGTQFTERTAGLPGRTVTNIKFKPGDPNTFYITLSGYGAGHIYKTTDKGATWINISSTLPDIPCNAFFIDPVHINELYVATDIGVFYSPDDGANWIPYGSNIPNVVINDMAYHKAKKVIRAASHGRSMWEIPLANNYSGISTPNIATKWYVGEKAQIAWYGMTGPVTVEYSSNGGADWKVIDESVTSSALIIPEVSVAAGFENTTNALIRVSNGTQTLLSQKYRILSRGAGSTFKVVSEQPLYMYDVAYDPDEKVLWVTNFNETDTKIYKIDPDNGNQIGSLNLGAGKNNLTGIKYHQPTQTFFIHQVRTSNNTSFVYQVNKSGQVIGQWLSPSIYGTGVFPREDTLYLADRNNNVIYRTYIGDPTARFDDILLDRKSPFGPRCITYNPLTDELLHTWTDFQGTEATATLYDSYLLRLDPVTGIEKSSYFVQEGGNVGTNVRGLEYDPRSDGKSVWVTVLNSGNSSKILKLSLVDGPQASISSKNIDEGEFTVFPNPVSSILSLRFVNDRSADITIIVRDIVGRPVLTEVLGKKAEGLQVHSFNVDHLLAGAYTCELYSDTILRGIRKLIKE